MPSAIHSLPEELLGVIASNSQPADLNSLLLTSKSFNEHLTPALYASIIPRSERYALKALRTLSAAPQKTTFGRDLPAIVRTFTLDFATYNLLPVKEKLVRRLVQAVSRMTGLQHFTCRLYCWFVPQMCANLMAAAAGTLRSLNVYICPKRHRPRVTTTEPESEETDLLAMLRPDLPCLESVTLEMTSDTGDFADFTQHLLTTCASRLRKLSLFTVEHEMAEYVIAYTEAWPVLQELEIDVRTLACRAIEFPATPRVHSLSSPNIPPSAFPKLEELCCSHGVLPAFLPPTMPSGYAKRPIRKVELDRARYEKNGGDFTRYGDPEWHGVRAVLAHLSNSAVPVTDLAFYVHLLEVPGLVDIAVVATNLERLLTVVYEDPVQLNGGFDALGAKLFAHMPDLHTFLVSDAPKKFADGAFMISEDDERKWLEAWDKHPNALREVAFCVSRMWTKTGNGWEMSDFYTEEKETEDEGDDESDSYDSQS
ncbi:hypothetical protein C8Q80DRAFT_1274002 [Daedaleopsis nitida]|nr:hypothetical protein C8Q80DRAFT_1274002 [Daedaleopsis nitida]